MTSKSFLLVVGLFAACGNYSNEDLEFMNAIPSGNDISANIPSALMPANEAELSALTHKTITDFNEPLKFLEAADQIRTWQPTGRIPNGRIWGPFPMKDHDGWQWRFTVMRDPAAPEMFSYAFEVQRIGGLVWISLFEGTFVATGGARKGMGHFHIGTDKLVAADFRVDPGPDGNILRDLDVIYSTAAYPISVTMTLVIYPAGLPANEVTIDYHYEAQANGQGAMDFGGTDSASGASIGIRSRWLSTGRGRADASATDGTVSGTRTQCWDDMFVETYNHTDWVPTDDRGNIADCPDISTL